MQPDLLCFAAAFFQPRTGRSTLDVRSLELQSCACVAVFTLPMKGSQMPRLFAVGFLQLMAFAAIGFSAGIANAAEAEIGYGPAPRLPDPQHALIPTVNIATAKPWAKGAKPKTAEGLTVAAFATGLSHPRWLYTLPNGDILVAETNAPERPDDAKGIRGWAMKLLMSRAGAKAPSENRIILLRDADKNGIAETRNVFLDGLNSPFGMALVGDQLYVANTDAVVRFPYKDGETKITGAGTKVADLPAGSINHHWTKNIIANRDGSKLYATAGSNSNVAENGMAAESNRAAILEIDIKSGATKVFASGLRNPNGMAWQPQSGMLWTVVNERDELGNDLVPDYLTSVHEGGFYGWPYSYYGAHIDDRVQPQKPDLVKTAVAPDYALGSHTASLGLVFNDGTALPAKFAGGAFIGQHGSWNRKPYSGYKVIFVPFKDGKPSGMPLDVLTGFVNDEGEALGRPVGVALDKSGALLVADDVGNTIWRVQAEPAKQSSNTK